MPLDIKTFRTELENLFDSTKDDGSLNISFKRVVLPHKTKAASSTDSSDKNPSTFCMVRVKTSKKKISTVV